MPDTNEHLKHLRTERCPNGDLWSDYEVDLERRMDWNSFWSGYCVGVGMATLFTVLVNWWLK